MMTIYNTSIAEMYNSFLIGQTLVYCGVFGIIFALLCLVAVGLIFNETGRPDSTVRWVLGWIGLFSMVFGFILVGFSKGQTSRNDLEAAIIYSIERDTLLTPLKKEQMVRDIKLIWARK